MNLDPASTAHLSNNSLAIVLMLVLYSDVTNTINKQEFTTKVGWFKDYRTWDKYWKELVDGSILAQLDKHHWMISPYQCYSSGINHKLQLEKWDILCSN